MLDPQQISAELAAQIEAASQAAYLELLRRVEAGEDARMATKAVQASFTGALAGATAAAFSQVLQREITAGSILALPVGDVVLSKHLHALDAAMADTVSAVIRTHAQGMQSARVLARRLYDGYNPADGIQRPLEGATRADLPKALRALTDDRVTRAELQQMYDYGQKAASRLKTEAMKAAYLQTYDAWADGAGKKALERALWVAQREKNRYAANRIAQTELARAHQEKVGQEFMADGALSVVQIKMNVKHPLIDICDYHSGADLFGLGKGIYPKAKAPRPPFHPHCWCRLISRPDKQASADLAEKQGAVQAYLKGLPPDQAARVLGSKERLQRVLGGARVDDVLNASAVKAYHVKRLGELYLSVTHPARAPLTMELDNPTMKIHPHALPNADRVTVRDSKFSKYALDASSDKGAHKAMLFKNILGYDLSNYSSLIDQIKIRVPALPAKINVLDQHGQRYTVLIPVNGPSGRSAMVTTAWIVRPGVMEPDLLSAYIETRRNKDV